MIRLSAFADEASPALIGQIEALKRNGIGYIDIRSIEGKNVLDFTEDEAGAYNEQLKAAGIKVYSIGSPIGKVSINCDFSEYLKSAEHICKLAKIFETDRIRMFSFFEAYEREAQVIDYLRSLVALADKYEVKLYHENEKKIFGDTAERTVKILDSVPGLLSIYDPANFVEVGEDMEKAMKLLHKRTAHFHIKDVIRETGELVPAGEGDGMLRELVSQIDTKAPEMVLTVEPHLAIFAGYSAIDDTEMKNKFHFESNDEAFDAAVLAIKRVICEAGYKENSIGGYEK